MTESRELLGMIDNWRVSAEAFELRRIMLEKLPLEDRLNVELAEKTVQFMLGHPENHNQSRWMHVPMIYAPGRTWYNDAPALTACGTTACLAGWATILDEARIAPEHVPGNPRIVLADVVASQVGSFDYAWNMVDLSEYAAVALGLNEQEADWLFHMDGNSAKGISAEERVLAAMTGAINRAKAARG